MNIKLALFVLLVVVLTPTAALANAGTPLLWAGMFHLLLGNALLGTVEAILLSRLFKVPERMLALFLIPANYLSAWIGFLLISPSITSNLLGLTIEALHSWFWILYSLVIFALFVLTLILEYPFFWLALRQRKNAFKEALKATAIVNAISYAILFGCYGAISDTSFLTQLQVVSLAQIQAPKGYDLYFISPDGKEVIKSDLLGMRKERVKTVSLPQLQDELLFRRNGEGKVELFIRANDPDSQFREEIVLPNVTASVPPTDQPYSPKQQIRKLTSSTDWVYRTGFWAAEGISGENEKQDLRFRFALETPLLAWFPKNATHIDGDFIVFELDNNQICLLQPQERKIALIGRGRSPVVAKP